MPERLSLTSLAKLEQALSRLEEALAFPEDAPLAVDGTIQRFEFVFELSWKSLRRFLAEEGLTASTPRETLRIAHEAGWLADERAWLEMLRYRNETSHTYDEKKALEIYRGVRRHFQAMVGVAIALRERVESEPEPGV